MLTSATLGMAAENSTSGSFSMTSNIGMDQRVSNVLIGDEGARGKIRRDLRVIPQDFEAAQKVQRPGVKIFIVRAKTDKT